MAVVYGSECSSERGLAEVPTGSAVTGLGVRSPWTRELGDAGIGVYVSLLPIFSSERSHFLKDLHLFFKSE